MTNGIFEAIGQLELECIEAGLEFRRRTAAIAKLKEEFQELLSALEFESPQRQETELADLLYMLVVICRLYELDAEAGVKECAAKLQRRIAAMQSLSLVPIRILSDDEQTELLKQVKNKEKLGGDRDA